MNKIIITLGLCALAFNFSSVSHSTDVYISIDENGNRIFSDTPSSESRTHKVKEISTIPAIKVPQRTTASPLDTRDSQLGYQHISINSPVADSHLNRGELGNFIVSVQISPALHDQDEAVLLYDGQEISSGQQLSWQINNADRGSHSLQVIIRQRDNKLEKIASKVQNIFVQR